MNSKTKKITVTALLCAMAYVITFVIHIPISAMTYDPKDVIITIAGFLFGPLTALVVAAVTTLLEMITISSTGYYGLLMNLASSAVFACTASLIYKKMHTLRGAQVGLLSAVFVTTGVMAVLNYIVVPLYYNMPTSGVIDMMPFLLGFNLIKSATNATIIALSYKPVTYALRKADLVPRSESFSAPSKKSSVISLVVAAVLFVICAVVMYFFQAAQK